VKYRDDKPRGAATTGVVQQRPAVGKRSLLDAAFRAQAVQKRSAAAPAPEPDEVHAAADAGVATPTTGLPYRDQLETSFGQDLSGVQAHVGGDAAASAGAMGAEAYAAGDHVVLPASPGLDVVAHEVAHVLQQRDGVQLHGGVGAAGDPYEQEADAAASAVVAGDSAAAVMRATSSRARVQASPASTPARRSGARRCCRR
jgi:hypothetical protein